MYKYSKIIENLFLSKGNFKYEYVKFLDNLTIENQKIFITELYKQVTSFKHDELKLKMINRSIGKRIINSIDDYDGDIIYQYENLDMEKAISEESLKEFDASRKLFKAEGKKDDEINKIIATTYFFERKVEEINWEIQSVEKHYKSINDRVNVINIIKNDVYEGFIPEFLIFKKLMNKRELQAYLKDNNFKGCFNSIKDYNNFKMNSFELLSKKDSPKFLNINLTSDNKKKMQ